MSKKTSTRLKLVTDTPSQDSIALERWHSGNLPLLETLMDAYCVIDNNNRVAHFNLAFMELCGESYAKILKLGDFCQLLPTEYCPSQCPAKQILSSLSPLRLDELSAKVPTFPNLKLTLSGMPLFSPSGDVLGSFLSIRNVSAESELQKKYSEHKTESITDGLTQLYNKTFTETAILRAVKGALRNSQAFSLVFCDIDHFKKVNDTYGHLAGDFVLKNVANILKETVRETDLIGRFGGEEFCIILMDSNVEKVGAFAEKLRAKIAKSHQEFERQTIPITISIGTATFHSEWRSGMDPERIATELLSRADAALYQSKGNGRNRVTQSETMPPKKVS